MCLLWWGSNMVQTPVLHHLRVQHVAFSVCGILATRRCILFIIYLLTSALFPLFGPVNLQPFHWNEAELSGQGWWHHYRCRPTSWGPRRRLPSNKLHNSCIKRGIFQKCVSFSNTNSFNFKQWTYHSSIICHQQHIHKKRQLKRTDSCFVKWLYGRSLQSGSKKLSLSTLQREASFFKIIPWRAFSNSWGFESGGLKWM